jgi:hypothetical protein
METTAVVLDMIHEERFFFVIVVIMGRIFIVGMNRMFGVGVVLPFRSLLYFFVCCCFICLYDAIPPAQHEAFSRGKALSAYLDP